MLEEDVTRIAKVIAELQGKIREDMIEELQENEDDLQSLFDPNSYTHSLDEIREKYIDKLWALQGILHEVANLDDDHRRRRTQLVSITAASVADLTKQVNAKLQALEGCAVQDVKFIKGGEDEWVAFVTYLANPFDRTRQEQKQDQGERE